MSAILPMCLQCGCELTRKEKFGVTTVVTVTSARYSIFYCQTDPIRTPSSPPPRAPPNPSTAHAYRLLLHRPPIHLAGRRQLCPAVALADDAKQAATRIMARSAARKETAAARPAATSPEHHIPSAPASSSTIPSPSPLLYPGALTNSCANPSTAPQFYPHVHESSSSFPSLNSWRPTYTAAPEGLLSFGQFPPMHPYNFRPPPMQHHDQGQQNLENFHFVGASLHDSFSTPPPPPHPKVASRSAPDKVHSTSSKKKRKTIDVDNNGSGERTAYHLPYTPEEHVRLAGAWLECSLDPIDGNAKKGEQFWDAIAALYNGTTPSNRKRDRNHLKMEWQRTKKRLATFHGEWIAVIGVYHSGHSTHDLERMALEKYEGNYGHPFQHLTMWEKLKDDGKWLASYKHMIGKGGKSPSVEINLTSNKINLEAEKRPSAGRDKAKAERSGKGKSGGISQELGERLDKFIEVNNQSVEDRQKVIDSQVLLSNQQLETAKINNKTKMLDVYSKMLLADTSKMDDGEKARRSKTMSRMEALLFPEGDSGDQQGGEVQ